MEFELRSPVSKIALSGKDVPDHDTESPTGDEFFVDFPPDGVDLGVEPLVIVDVAEVILAVSTVLAVLEVEIRL
jgi:hypothetical protein